MPRARRRRSHSVARRRWGRTLLLCILAAVTALLVVGSLVEIHSQSGDYRTSTDTGYGQLAWPVVEASNRTGSELAGLMGTAAQLPNQLVPQTARAEIQQGLDQAVHSTSEQATQAAGLVPPDPTGTVSQQFTRVLSERATAATALRTAVDQLLGMAPLSVAGAPTSSTAEASGPLSSIAQASAAMSAAGALFVQADARYRNLLAYVRQQRIPIELPESVWVPAPVADAPLGPAPLGATASALNASVPLIPVHLLVITAVGLSPPAVTTGAAGNVADSCAAPASTVPTATPTVLPPTTSIKVAVVVTNCGTVLESGVVVTETLTLVDPPGTAVPPPGARGGRARARVTLPSGSSAAPTLPPLGVAGGHLYDLGLAVVIPPGQHNPTGSTQQFFLQISS